MYVVDGDDGPLTWDGPIELERADDTAICGKNGATLEIPAGYRSYAVWMVREDAYSEGGTGFLWSGIDLDQTAEGAYGRIDAHVNDKAIIEYMKTIGRGRPADPDPTSPLHGTESGAAIFPSAQTADGETIVRNVEMVHGGVYAEEHFGDRNMGIWLGPAHEGTLHVRNTRIEEFPNNALYASNVPGDVIAKNCRFYNNGVSNGRISHGAFVNCTVGFDYENTGMANADASEHGLCGLAVEQKKSGKGGTPPTIKDCSVHMKNVAKGGQGIKTYVAHGGDNHIKAILGCDVHEYNVGNAPDIAIAGAGSSCEEVRDCTFSGSASGGTSVVNPGPEMIVADNSFDYPPGREKYKGNIKKVSGD